VIPFLGDDPSQLRATVRAIAASGATSVTPLVLHLRPGAREWFMSWLAHHHPYLVRRYERLYTEGAYAPKWYQRRITRQVHELAEEYGIGPTRAGMPRRIPAPAEPALPEPTQLTLL
jgi:DNA repair photolyase